MTRPELADTYRLLAERGRDAFYEGEIADRIDAWMRENGGYLRKADFEQHTSTWVEPVSVDYRGYEVYELPPNGQGIAALQMLQILEGYDLAGMGRNSAQALHHMVEEKLAFEDRAKYYADPDFADVPVQQLISEEYAARRRGQIGGDASFNVRAGELPEEGDTIYLTTADSAGWHGLPHPEQLPRHWVRGIDPCPGCRSCPGPRRALHPSTPTTANGYAPGKRSLPHHHPRPRDAATARPPASFGAHGRRRCSRRATPRS
ncbi:MAG: gamma-glutamyltransferase [Balneolaceae bacterium]|nr:gamma-glutamyltransferase [Balneolaceae bacterium]